MAIPVKCRACGTEFRVKEEFVGRKVRCSECQDVLVVSTPEPGMELAETNGNRAKNDDRPRRRREEVWDDEDDVDEDQFDADDIFDRDVFLLRQKLLANFTQGILGEKYNVSSENGRPILFIERPARAIGNILALLAFVGVAAVCGVGTAAATIFVDQQANEGAAVATAIFLGIGSLVLAFLAYIRVVPRRHITFYADESKQDPLLRVLQVQKVFLINAWFTLVDDRGELVARFRKNYIYNILRKRWYIYRPDGELLCVVKEDSLVKSILRRTIGQIFDEAPLLALFLAGVFRTNFIFVHPETQETIGEFNRKFTIRDRYVLDMNADPDRLVDRRIAAAMGVLLDTGEGR